jgi:hypothetical protein
VVALALLGAPRVVLHDLGLGTHGPLAGLLAIGPFAVWIFVTLRARCPRPLVTLLAIGVLYGCILAIGHHLFMDDITPRFGGTLEGRLSPGVEAAFLRTALTVSSIFTGAAVGLVCGLFAVMLRSASRRGTR